jgi:hypothetical protein
MESIEGNQTYSFKDSMSALISQVKESISQGQLSLICSLE